MALALQQGGIEAQKDCLSSAVVSPPNSQIVRSRTAFRRAEANAKSDNSAAVKPPATTSHPKAQFKRRKTSGRAFGVHGCCTERGGWDGPNASRLRSGQAAHPTRRGTCSRACAKTSLQLRLKAWSRSNSLIQCSSSLPHDRCGARGEGRWPGWRLPPRGQTCGSRLVLLTVHVCCGIL